MAVSAQNMQYNAPLMTLENMVAMRTCHWICARYIYMRVKCLSESARDVMRYPIVLNRMLALMRANA